MSFQDKADLAMYKSLLQDVRICLGMLYPESQASKRPIILNSLLKRLNDALGPIDEYLQIYRKSLKGLDPEKIHVDSKTNIVKEEPDPFEGLE